jgi:hypothetical protein
VTTPARNSIDLHTHTRRSDGLLEPRALYEAMTAWGLELAAITDHDTLAAPRELRAAGLGLAASRAGPRLISGVEINTPADAEEGGLRLGRDGEELHILGYGVDLDDAGLEEALARQREGRRVRFRRTLQRLRELGMDIEPPIVLPGQATGDPSPAEGAGTGGPAEHDALGRPHIARALVAAGFASSVEDAFARILGHGCPAYVPRPGMGPREAIARITAAGGLAVLAHAPGAPDAPELIEALMAWGLRGLEVHYRTFDDVTVARLSAFAREARLVATGGSDYHGDLMDYATAQLTTWVPPSAGEALLAALGETPSPPATTRVTGAGAASEGPARGEVAP